MPTLIITLGLLTGPILVLPPKQMWLWINGLCFLLGWLAVVAIFDPNDGLALVLGLGLAAFMAITLFLRIVLFLRQNGYAAIGPSKHNWALALPLVNGAGIAAFLFALMIHMSSGRSWAIPLHVWLGGLAISVLLYGRRSTRLLPASFGISLIALTVFSTLYPIKVQHAARHVAKGARHCIYLNMRQRFSQNVSDLTFLTFDKSDFWAHAILIIETPDGAQYGNWSYRQGRFMVPWDLHTTRPTLHCP